MSEAAASDESALGDFTGSPRLLVPAGVAVGLGVLAAAVARGLILLIDVFTNLFFFHRLSSAHVSPAAAHVGAWTIAIPAAGGLVIGLMARFGSERIRGHGIPEAIESILTGGSRVDPRVAILKPISAAISIGSGGPFGAEGPIILTGGAIGSVIAQFGHLTAAERKTLLVAGAAAGMSATFATPLAAILLSVELLLFEWKPRSFVPVALASVSAGAARRYLLGLGPLFPVAPHPLFLGPALLLACAGAGLAAGALALGLTRSVYAAEDAFARLPVHWMWWPILGGLAVGAGGYIFPPALGIGYDTIGAMLQDQVSLRTIAGVLGVKWTIWAIALGSGTSGGVLAPLLMIGGALGGLEAHVLPDFGVGFWPLVGMSAALGGTMRSPLTAVVFGLELTHDFNMMVPLIIAVTIAHCFTVLTLRRSILTEKVSRRGHHLSREYHVDVLETLFVRDAMRRHILALPATATVAEIQHARHASPERRRQRLLPVVAPDATLVGIVTGDRLDRWLSDRPASAPIAEIVEPARAVAYPDEPLRVVVNRMAGTGVTRLPVLERGADRRLAGMIGISDLLAGRRRHLESEERRERVLSLDLRLFGNRSRRAS